MQGTYSCVIIIPWAFIVECDGFPLHWFWVIILLPWMCRYIGCFSKSFQQPSLNISFSRQGFVITSFFENMNCIGADDILMNGSSRCLNRKMSHECRLNTSFWMTLYARRESQRERGRVRIYSSNWLVWIYPSDNKKIWNGWFHWIIARIYTEYFSRIGDSY